MVIRQLARVHICLSFSEPVLWFHLESFHTKQALECLLSSQRYKLASTIEVAELSNSRRQNISSKLPSLKVRLSRHKSTMAGPSKRLASLVLALIFQLIFIHTSSCQVLGEFSSSSSRLLLNAPLEVERSYHSPALAKGVALFTNRSESS